MSFSSFVATFSWAAMRLPSATSARLKSCHGFERGVDAGHRLAIEFHLLAHVPIEHARNHALPGLHQRIDHAAGARVHGSDGGHLAERRIARVGQRHQVGQGDFHTARGSFRIARAHPVADLVQQRDQFSAFHGVPST